MPVNPNIEIKVLEMYDRVPEYVREDICLATTWAKNYLARKEGEGHDFYVTANKDGTVTCSFAKPEWKADHSGRGMDHGAQAIIMAVCEYWCGL